MKEVHRVDKSKMKFIGTFKRGEKATMIGDGAFFAGDCNVYQMQSGRYYIESIAWMKEYQKGE